MKPTLKIPLGYRILRIGEIIRRGDKFKKENGCWSRTSDLGRKVDKKRPSFENRPEYSGIYIRKIPA